MERQSLAESWAETDADLRWVLAHSALPADCVRVAIENLGHNEFGVAWEAIAKCLHDPTPDIAARMQAARQRMGNI